MAGFRVEINPSAGLHSSLVEELNHIAKNATTLDHVEAWLKRCVSREGWLVTRGGHHVALNSKHVTYNTTHRVAMICEVTPS